jgi:DNA-binding NarL/FixJ family response regulator
LIVDDSLDFLAAATSLLEREQISVVGVATNLADALRAAERFNPDVVLVDIMLADESGFELTRQLLAEGHLMNGTNVILTSTHSEEDFADMIAASPARGFVPKSELSAGRICAILGLGSR